MTKPRQALRADELVAGAHGLVHTPEGVRGPITRITRPFPRYPGSKLKIHVVGGQSMRARPWALFYLPDDDEGEKEVEATVVEAPPLPVEALITVPVVQAPSRPAGVSVEASPLPVPVEAPLSRDPVRGGGAGDEVETLLLPVGSR